MNFSKLIDENIELKTLCEIYIFGVHVKYFNALACVCVCVCSLEFTRVRFSFFYKLPFSLEPIKPSVAYIIREVVVCKSNAVMFIHKQNIKKLRNPIRAIGVFFSFSSWDDCSSIFLVALLSYIALSPFRSLSSLSRFISFSQFVTILLNPLYS